MGLTFSRGEISTSAEISQAAQIACFLDVLAEKPGNVSITKKFPDAGFQDFILSAIAIGPALSGAGAVSVGETVLQAVQATRKLVSTNTNLGIVLLLVPLAKAYGLGELRQNLPKVLGDLTVSDAQKVFEAVQLASPGGLGRVSQGDVHETAEMTLREAMFLARDRDSIAREYVTDFEIVFFLGYPSLCHHYRESGSITQAIVQAFLEILAKIPDSLIARKTNRIVAENISQLARKVLDLGGTYSQKGREEILQFDNTLRKTGSLLNPGTTADLIVASVFVALLEGTISLQFYCGERREISETVNQCGE